MIRLGQFSEGIRKASLDAYLCSIMLQVGVLIESLKSYVSIGNYSRWCPGPELNRHAPVKEAQDFKSCTPKLNLSEITKQLTSSPNKEHQKGIVYRAFTLIDAPFLTARNSSICTSKEGL